MANEKALLQEKFSKDYEKYYLVDLFKRKGYVRKKCASCGKHFWTLKPEKTTCDDQPCAPYSFIGDPPTTKRFDYVSGWKTIEAWTSALSGSVIQSRRASRSTSLEPGWAGTRNSISASMPARMFCSLPSASILSRSIRSMPRSRMNQASSCSASVAARMLGRSPAAPGGSI